MLYKNLKTLCLILLALFLCETLYAQKVTLLGVVRDRNTLQRIKSVNIFVRGTKLGTTSNLSGYYELKVPGGDLNLIVVFQHIAYNEYEISIKDLMQRDRIYLQPRVIPLKEIEIEEEAGAMLEIKKDLPQAVTVIDARSYDMRGYVDAGDLLKTDQSVQIEEELSGKKTAAIRGGNADEVVVLYNGVKMNNAYDNIFDLSLIDLENVERFELIKGSNTALYGPEAFSGVINIVPKVEQDYNIRFQQRLGTYRSGNWGLHFYKRFNRLFGSYSIKRGGQSRTFIGEPSSSGKLENSSLHHTANLNLNVGTNADGDPKGVFSSMWIYTALDYDNRRDRHTLDNFNNLFSFKYDGELMGYQDFIFSFSQKNLEEDQNLGFSVDRDIKDRTYIFNAQKEFHISALDLLLSYQFENNKLDFLDFNQGAGIDQVGLEAADLSRNHHGLVSILKYHGETGSDFLQTIDVDLSVRHDRIKDNQDNIVLRDDNPDQDEDALGLFGKNNWHDTMLKFALDLSGYRNGFSFNSFLSFGSNTKFPTLFQQISQPALNSASATVPNLSPEENRSVEFGAKLGRDIRGHSSIYGWQISGSFFQNHYDNKFREWATPGMPVTFYDNVQNAKISGFESKSALFLFKKKISIDMGLSKYFISDKAAFPFKSDLKRTLTFNIDHAGFAFQLFWFKESDQVALLRFLDGTFESLPLPGNTNLDLHLSKTIEISRLKLFINASGRNLLNDEDIDLEGIAIRDRRFYLTLGAQY